MPADPVNPAAETLIEIIKRAVPSWTFWTAILWGALTLAPDILEAVVEAFGMDGEAGTARLVAITLFITRLRSIVIPPLLAMFAAKESPE